MAAVRYLLSALFVTVPLAFAAAAEPSDYALIRVSMDDDFDEGAPTYDRTNAAILLQDHLEEFRGERSFEAATNRGARVHYFVSVPRGDFLRFEASLRNALARHRTIRPAVGAGEIAQIPLRIRTERDGILFEGSLPPWTLFDPRSREPLKAANGTLEAVRRLLAAYPNTPNRKLLWDRASAFRAPLIFEVRLVDAAGRCDGRSSYARIDTKR
jgi:hypothetical protein